MKFQKLLEFYLQSNTQNLLELFILLIATLTGNVEEKILKNISSSAPFPNIASFQNFSFYRVWIFNVKYHWTFYFWNSKSAYKIRLAATSVYTMQYRWDNQAAQRPSCLSSPAFKSKRISISFIMVSKKGYYSIYERHFWNHIEDIFFQNKIF